MTLLHDAFLNELHCVPEMHAKLFGWIYSTTYRNSVLRQCQLASSLGIFWPYYVGYCNIKQTDFKYAFLCTTQFSRKSFNPVSEHRKVQSPFVKAKQPTQSPSYWWQNLKLELMHVLWAKEGMWSPCVKNVLCSKQNVCLQSLSKMAWFTLNGNVNMHNNRHLWSKNPLPVHEVPLIGPEVRRWWAASACYSMDLVFFKETTDFTTTISSFWFTYSET